MIDYRRSLQKVDFSWVGMPIFSLLSVGPGRLVSNDWPRFSSAESSRLLQI